VTSRIRHLWANHRRLLLAFSLAVLVMVFFVTRAVVFAVYWSDPKHRNQPLEAWMTPRYVAKSYDVPLNVIVSYLNVSGNAGHKTTLSKVAKSRGTELDTLQVELVNEIIAYRNANQ